MGRGTPNRRLPMPAPNRRNKGEVLAHQIADHAAPRSIDDSRDRLKAHRVRDAQGWEASAAVLTRAMASEAVPSPAQVRPLAGPRHYLGKCWDCDRSLWVHSMR